MKKHACAKTFSRSLNRISDVLGHRHALRRHQAGQTLVIFALSAIVVMGVLGFAVDGGYGLFQKGEAQNAADFASLAVATNIADACDSTSSNPATPIPQSTIVNTIADVVGQNDPQEPSSWTAVYTDATSTAFGSTFSPTSDAYTFVPIDGQTDGVASTATNTACGIRITVTPNWQPFVEGIIGIHNLSTSAEASSIYKGPTPGSNLDISIVSLDPHGAHTIFMGTGTFNVTGTIGDNADGVVCDKCGSGSTNWGSVHGMNIDTVDEKAGGQLTVSGTVQSYVWDPFDGCFGGSVPPATGGTLSCGSESITYSNTLPNQPQVPDQFGNYASPDSLAGCPGSAGYQTTNPSPVTSGNTITYYPGIYTSTLALVNGLPFTSTVKHAVFADCTGQTGDPSHAGFYVFENGAEILPPAGDTVTGSDVLFIGTNPIPQFSGGGVPDLQWLTTNDTGITSSNAYYDQYYCGSCYNGSTALETSGFDNGCVSNCTGSGTGQYGQNFSIVIGGQGNTTFSGVVDPNLSHQQSTYNQFFIWQDANSIYCNGTYSITWSDNTCEANIGMDAIPPGGMNVGKPIYDSGVGKANGYDCGVGTDNACYPGDSGTITINNSVLYDNSEPQGNLMPNGEILPNYYNNNGSNGGYPFSAGGAIIVGSGDDCTTPGFCTTGTVDIQNGVALLGRFSTNGKTVFNIVGSSTFVLPGVLGSGPSLVG